MGQDVQHGGEVALSETSPGADPAGPEPADPAGAHRGENTSRSLPRRLLPHWPIVAVVGAFAGSAFVIPTLSATAISDDFLYARSVEILLHDGELRMLPAAAVTGVFQIVWGALFGAVFGDSLGVLRAATVTFALFGGVAMYGLCRELGVTKGRSALGAAIYLFNPISFVLSYTFMTDAYLITLITVAAYCYVRGLRSDAPDERWTVAGSVVAGLAFLVRHPGILVVVGVLTYLAASGRLGRRREALRTAAQAALAPAVMVVAYFIWFRFIQGVPEGSNQVGFFRAFPDAGFDGIWELGQRLVVLGAVYTGLFVLPVAIAALWRVPGLLRRFGTWRWITLGVLVVGVFLLAVGDFAPFDARRPWSPQFFRQAGLGPTDLRGGRPEVLDETARDVILELGAVSAVVLAVVLLRRLKPLRSAGGAGAGVLGAIAVWLAIGVLAPSLPLRDGNYSYDRYFLPLLPMIVALVLWALRSVRMVTPLAWVAVVVMGAFSVAGTHDHLTYQEATWKVAADAHAAGIDYVDIDGGAAWDGYRLYEYSYENEVTIDLEALADLDLEGPLLLSENDVEAWWIPFYAAAVTGEYVVSSEVLVGYEVVERVPYSAWLQSEYQYMYLLRRPGADGPPDL